MSNSGGTVTVTSDDVANLEKEKATKKEQNNEYVRRQAYEEVTTDMHKYKSRVKETEARAAELEARLKAIEEQKLKDEQKYQELYEREKKQREMIETDHKKSRELYLRAVKMQALKSELGNVKDIYLSHADINSIEVRDDGTLNSDTVRDVANRFRQEHPGLIQSNVSSNITNMASPTSFSPSSNQKTLKDMSYEEKAAYLKSIKNK